MDFFHKLLPQNLIIHNPLVGPAPRFRRGGMFKVPLDSHDKYTYQYIEFIMKNPLESARIHLRNPHKNIT